MSLSMDISLEKNDLSSCIAQIAQYNRCMSFLITFIRRNRNAKWEKIIFGSKGCKFVQR